MTQPALSRLEVGGVIPIPLLDRISAELDAAQHGEIAAQHGARRDDVGGPAMRSTANAYHGVNDLQAAVDCAATEAYGLVGGIGEYEGACRMPYVRGPEGIIVSLAERIR
jgi:hypothetical protein